MLENPWLAVGNPTSALGPSGSSFGPPSLAPTRIHHLLRSNLTTGDLPQFIVKSAYNNTDQRFTQQIKTGLTEKD